jgi:hypothetical protein
MLAETGRLAGTLALPGRYSHLGKGTLFAAGDGPNCSMAGPWIVGAEVPEMTFQIAARVAAATVVFVFDIHHNLGARSPGAGCSVEEGPGYHSTQRMLRSLFLGRNPLGQP